MSDKKYSGKVLLRLPSSLHKQCVELAKEEGVSLNQFLLCAAALQVGKKSVTVGSRRGERGERR